MRRYKLPSARAIPYNEVSEVLSTRLGVRTSVGWKGWPSESINEVKLKVWLEEAQNRLVHSGSNRRVLMLATVPSGLIGTISVSV